MRKKDLLANFLFRYSKHLEGALRKKADKAPLRVLAYHRVYTMPNPDYPFNPELISVLTEDFERQIEFVSSNFNVINFKQLKSLIENNETVPPDTIVITFDDGYEDNYSFAFPILKAHKCTATIFVSTHYLDSGEPFWFDQLAYIINKTQAKKIQLPDFNLNLALTENNRTTVRRSIGTMMKQMSDSDRVGLLAQIAEYTGVDVSEADLSLARPLTWDKARTLYENGIEIGSHTVNHPFLSQLTDDEIRLELVESKQKIEQEIGGEVVSLCYPSGDFDERVKRIAAEANYAFATSYRHQVEPFSEDIRYDIPRIHVELDVSLPLFKANLLMPKLFLGSL